MAPKFGYSGPWLYRTGTDEVNDYDFYDCTSLIRCDYQGWMQCSNFADFQWHNYNGKILSCLLFD